MYSFVNNIANASKCTIEYIPYQEAMRILYTLNMYLDNSSLLGNTVDFAEYNDRVLFHYVLIDLFLGLQKCHQDCKNMAEGDLILAYGQANVPDGFPGSGNVNH